MSFIIYKTLKIVLKNNIKSYQEFIDYILPTKLKKNKIIKYTINNIINIFLLISFYIMVAGFATYFVQELNISKWVGAIVIAVLIIITLTNKIEGVIKINTYLVPIIILSIIFLGINKIKFSKIVSLNNVNSYFGYILNSILYASYNSITLIPILISLKNKINKKSELIITTVVIGIIMIILSVIIFLLINSYITEIIGVEIPILYITNKLGKIFKYIYGLIILSAIFTTAVGSSYGFLNNISSNRKKYITYLVIMCLLSVFIGQLMFSDLINLLYPIFGYLGIIQIILLIII